LYSALSLRIYILSLHDALPISFRMAALGSFDPFVYPFVALTTEAAQLEHQEASWGGGPKAYAKRYATAFGDNAIGNFMTTAIVRSEEHTSELQSHLNLVCRLLL